MLWMVMLVLFLAGCGASHPSDTAAGQELAEDSTVQKGSYTYRTEEIWCDNNGNRIYGIAYIPDTQEEKKPLVIFAHELGNTHAAGIPYAERLAEAGCGAYVFDFCGGTVGGGNRSSGSNVGMSVLTEVTDLEAVLETAATWDFVDPRRETKSTSCPASFAPWAKARARASELLFALGLVETIRIFFIVGSPFYSPRCS